MKSPLILLAAVAAAASATAAEPVRTQPARTAQVNALVRVLKVDGSTVLGQAPVSPGGTGMPVVNVKSADALVRANGRCAFNLKIDEVATAAASNTTNRIYSNDALVAQTTRIDLQAGVLRSVLTQPYLFAGANNVRVVLNADGAQPSTGWLRINVDGTCVDAPKPPPVPVRVIVPGSGDWNALYNAWGYSNYAVTQLKGKGYARYADLAKLNADLAAVVAARRVEGPAHESLMARWNGFTGDAAFKAAMAAVVPTGDRK